MQKRWLGLVRLPEESLTDFLTRAKALSRGEFADFRLNPGVMRDYIVSRILLAHTEHYNSAIAPVLAVLPQIASQIADWDGMCNLLYCCPQLLLPLTGPTDFMIHHANHLIA